MVIIIMGVTASGKTTIAKALSEKTNIPYYDADQYHSEANILKMSDGIPLTDEDRKEWLESLSVEIAKWQQNEGAILACSALKKTYRQKLQSKSELPIQWIYLKVPQEIIQERIEARKNHFMNKSLVASQFAILEPPENGYTVDGTNSTEKIIEEITNKIKS
ncbi:gluconokinase [Fulvivirga maritima]|uniref:gluconokinase n=1 Tax=Fulvivirga maritima TaxID=2904247 RepID=UPI001F350470|nr:gluconokinase [Fulvivirga maritima]UII24961.1 gluconokinase [Fulvivirga maritima]